MKKEKSANIPSEKMTIYEYEQKYTKRSNLKGAKLLLGLIASSIGIFLFFCLFSVTLRVFELELPSNLNIYLGIATSVISVVLYVFLFIVPLVKIGKLNYFVTNVNAMTVREAKRRNKKVRHELADKIIEVTSKVEGVGWYDAGIVGKLAIAQTTNDEQAVKENLSALYSGCVKKNAQDMILKASVKTAMYSAVSQTNKVDAMLVAVLNMQLVKDILFLYGFRPSDAKLVKVFGSVLRNSLVAYGVGGIKIGNTIVQTMGNAVKGIPLLGAAISTVVDSSIQGFTNGVLTAVIGRQTIKYLSDEYRLQDILDGIEIEESQEEFENTCNKLERELKVSRAAKVS
ncbi:MAG: YcjF family protein [Corallococcus sp.]|nr:YcjF family protein [Corallococcus sp.]